MCESKNNTTEDINVYTQAKTDIDVEYKTLCDQLSKLEKELENLLLRIVGVTDYILLEQLQQDCIDIENTILVTKASCKELEQVIALKISEDIKNSHIEFYSKQFKISDPITCLEKTNNITLRDFIKNKRLRLPENITQKRELCIIANDLNKKIVLLDYEGNIIDYIGKGIDEIKLYCKCFLRFNQEPADTIYLLCDK
jgi:hypothetical protein